MPVTMQVVGFQPAPEAHETTSIQGAGHETATECQETVEEHIGREEIDAFLLELQHQEGTISKRKRRLNADEKGIIRLTVADVDQATLQASIARRISCMTHISGIAERRLLWEHVKQSEFFSKVCGLLLKEYICLYKECDKGADKYARFHLRWYEQIQCPTSAVSKYLSAGKVELATSYGDRDITDDTWATLGTTLLYATFNEVQTIMAQHIPLTNAENVQPVASEEGDVALLRLGGWALFSCINYRRNALKGKTKIQHTSTKLEAFKLELNLLEALVDTEKVNLPTGIAAQDRGYMTLPTPSLMSFLKALNRKIKGIVNPSAYACHGAKLLDVAASNVLHDEEVQKEWAAASLAESTTVTDAVRKALTLKMLHSQFKEFATNTKTLETLQQGKSADIDLALRTKLKTYAAEKHIIVADH